MPATANTTDSVRSVQVPSEKTRLIKFPVTQRTFTYRYDYDVGYLVKSPCRECDHRETLPACTAECIVLDDIQTLLATTLSSCKKD